MTNEANTTAAAEAQALCGCIDCTCQPCTCDAAKTACGCGES